MCAMFFKLITYRNPYTNDAFDAVPMTESFHVERGSWTALFHVAGLANTRVYV